MSEVMTTGIYDGIPHADYHAMTDFVSNSYLNRINKCPMAGKKPIEDNANLAFGRAQHCHTLEGMDAFFKEFVVIPKISKTTKEGKAVWKEAEEANPGKSIITADDFQTIQEITDAVMNHKFASTILAQGISEQTVIWQDEATGIWCKCRPDRIPTNGAGVLVDLKTTSDASEYGFGRSVSSYGYARQAAMYLDGANAASGNDFDAFIFVAVEKEFPYRVETYLLDAEYIQWGRSDYRRLLNVELECREKGAWPNYQSDVLITLFKPGYL